MPIGRLSSTLLLTLVMGVAALAGCRGGQKAEASAAAVGTPAAAKAPAAPAIGDDELIDEAMRLIEPFEGRRHRVYRDTTGHLTVGVGFNLDRGDARETLAKVAPNADYRALRRGKATLSDAQIDRILRHDTARALASARRHVPNFDQLPHEAKLVLIDMSFNLGSVAAFRDLRAAVARHDFAAAADAMHDSRWRTQTGQRAQHLIVVMRSLGIQG